MNLEQIHIEQAGVDKLDAMVDLFNEYRIFYGKTSDLDGCRSFLFDRIVNRQSIIFLAKTIDHSYIGFTQLYPIFSSVSMQRTLILNDLYVKENARRKGVAEKLMQTVIGYGKATGNKGLQLETAKENATAQALYQKFGFQIEDTYLSMHLTF
ncbi:GNAT family N-acetyltransferase [Leptospira ognonensis]|uniref:GNAT family N-acetyltransferase n=1 Tax=Leptospira ognonensis TaxID=2484945 RepID=UPI001FE6B1FA|nr:GNAT family N-acetyltransferase [Leptospira ognonensis]